MLCIRNAAIPKSGHDGFLSAGHFHLQSKQHSAIPGTNRENITNTSKQPCGCFSLVSNGFECAGDLIGSASSWLGSSCDEEVGLGVASLGVEVASSSFSLPEVRPSSCAGVSALWGHVR